MPVKYYLYELPFERLEEPYGAHVTEEESLSDQDIEDRMANSGSGFTRANIKGVRELERKVVLDAVREGKGLRTRLVTGGYSMGGGFADADALYNPEHNSLLYNMWAGPDVVAATKEAHAQKTAGPKAGPIVLHVHDQDSGSTDNTLTGGGIVRVTGERLSVKGTLPSVGIVLRSISGTDYAVDLRQLVVNKPKELIFRLPALPANQYNLLITTQGSTGKLLKTPHTTIFDKILTVA